MYLGRELYGRGEQADTRAERAGDRNQSCHYFPSSNNQVNVYSAYLSQERDSFVRVSRSVQ